LKLALARRLAPALILALAQRLTRASILLVMAGLG
jgi:hypothetical protein